MMIRKKVTLLLLISVSVSGKVFCEDASKTSRKQLTWEKTAFPGRKRAKVDIETKEKWNATLTKSERKEAARKAIIAFFKALEEKKLDALVKVSGVPFWMDGNLLDSEKSLRADFTRQLGFSFKPTKFTVVNDFRNITMQFNYPMNGMALLVSDGKRKMKVTVQFGKSTVVVGVD